MEKGRKYSIGEFARANGVTKHTLIHYEDIGLLTPAVTEENGYRYYINQQYSAFSSIAQLKEIGLPLKEIDAYLYSRSPQKLMGILERREAQLAQEKRRLDDLKRSMAICRNRIEEALAADVHSVSMQFCETEYGFFSRNLYEDGETFGQVKAAFSSFCRKKDLFEYRGWGTIIPVRYVDGKWLSISSHIYVHADPVYHPDAVAIWPQGYYLVAYHQGEPQKLYQCFLRVMRYAEKQGMKIGKFCFEEYMLGDFVTTDPAQYRTKILVPVI
ncbi:MAG: MerR family transcriptional regulator [Oscillospiraceae bacterium]|nr:MerR family transcriptional regulator [Oscillospiraceae bacterium]